MPETYTYVPTSWVILQYLGLVFKSAGSARAAWVAIISYGSTSSCWGLHFFFIFELFNVATKFYMIASFKRLSAAKRADLNLCISAIEITVFNIAAWFVLPELQRTKNFGFLFYSIMLISGLGLPPAHVLMSWLICSPAYL